MHCSKTELFGAHRSLIQSVQLANNESKHTIILGDGEEESVPIETKVILTISQLSIQLLADKV